MDGNNEENKKLQKANELEDEATAFFHNNEYEKAFNAFDTAAYLYKDMGIHHKASACFSGAAHAWQIKSGESHFYNTSSRYYEAAEEAMKYHDYQWAKFMYKEAARFYQKEDISPSYSYCFYMTKICDMKHAWLVATRSRKLINIPGKGFTFTYKKSLTAFLSWVGYFLNYSVWGFGEKPYKAFLSALFMIFFSSSIFYFSGGLVYQGNTIVPSYFDSLYFSVITFNTLGYGDYHPIGNFRLMAMVEALSGLFLVPLFLVALTRKYLRS